MQQRENVNFQHHLSTMLSIWEDTGNVTFFSWNLYPTPTSCICLSSTLVLREQEHCHQPEVVFDRIK